MTAPYDPTAGDLIPPLPLLTGSARVVVAYSGGLDSTVLLHALAARGVPGLVAVHIHHGLQQQADDWVAHCARFCADLSLPLTLCRALIAADDPAGPEAAARAARYALLRDEVRAGDLLVTAHHRDDQAETVLLRLLRGSGVHGLAAMRPLSSFSPGRLWRPFLDQPREMLHRYAVAQGLSWIEDPHNHDPRFARSWLREELLPKLRERWPQAYVSIARGARLAAETVELLDVLAGQDEQAIARDDALIVPGLRALSAARRHNLLRHWLRRQNFEVPFASMFERIDEEVLAAAADATPLLRWPGCELRRFRDELHAMAPLPAPPGTRSGLLWSGDNTLALPAGCGMLSADGPPPRPVVVRWVHDGEFLKPGGAGRTRTCKNLFQEAGMPPWVRARAPLLELDGKPACIAGVAATAEWRGLLAQSGWQVHWRHQLAGVDSPVSL